MIRFGDAKQYKEIIRQEAYEFIKEHCEKIWGPIGNIFLDFVDGDKLVATCVGKQKKIRNWRTEKWYVEKINKKKEKLEKQNLTFNFLKQEEVDGRNS